MGEDLAGNHQEAHRINKKSGEECLGNEGKTREMRQETGLGMLLLILL